MKSKTPNEEQRLSSKAPFLAAIIFFAICWGSRSIIFNGSSGVNYFENMAMALYGLLGVAATVMGVYLQVTGKKTIDPPRARHLIWSFISLLFVTAIAIATIYVQSSPFG